MGVSFTPEVLENDEERNALTAEEHEAAADAEADPRVALAFKASWVVNIALLLAKFIAFIATGSKSVMAALADSAVDVLSQVVIALAEYSDAYPVGRSRLEALGVLGCAAIMSMASLEVIRSSSADLYDGFANKIYPDLEVGPLSYTILIVGTVAKGVLYGYCKKTSDISDSIAALAEDHLNDVMSNSLAIVTMSVAASQHKAWWCDPMGANLISFVIIYRWFHIIREQVQKVVGAAAPQEFVDSIAALCKEHDHRIVEVDCIRAYHFGSRFNVEVEIILPGAMSLVESHDLGLSLQDRIEGMDECERAFVHMDYRKRSGPEHKIERSLQNLQRAEERALREKKRRRRFSGKTWAKVAFLLPGGGGGGGGGRPQQFNGGGRAGSFGRRAGAGDEEEGAAMVSFGDGGGVAD